MKSMKPALAPLPNQARWAFWISVSLLVVILVYDMVVIYQALESNLWQQQIASISLSLALTVTYLACVVLARQGRVGWAMGLMIGSILAAAVLVTLVYSGVGFALAIAAFAVASSVAILTLPTQWSSRLVVLSALTGMATILVDIFGPADRLPLASVEFLNGLMVTVVVAYGVFVAAQFRRYSLRTKLIIIFLFVALLPTVALTYLNDRSTRDSLAANTNQTLRTAAGQTAGAIDTFLTTTRDELANRATLPFFGAYLDALARYPADLSLAEKANVDASISSFVRQDYVLSYALLDIKGRNVIDVQPLFDISEVQTDYFRAVVEKQKPYISPVLYGPDKVPAIFFSAPVFNANNQLVGVLRARYVATVLQDIIMAHPEAAGEGSFAILLDENYLRLAHGWGPKLVGKLIVPLNLDRLVQLQRAQRLPVKSVAELSTNLTDLKEGLDDAAFQPYFRYSVQEELSGTEDQTLPHDDLVAVTRLDSQPWQVAYVASGEIAAVTLEEQTRVTTLIALGLALLVTLIALLTAQVLAAPIVRLTATAEKVRAGDLTAEAKVEASDEVGVLAATFNQMTAQLRETLVSLERRVAERTRALAISAEVSRRLSTILDQQQLVNEVVEQVREAFNYYHAQIYLLDDRGEALKMMGGTGDVGRIMLERGHQLPKGRGLVGRAADTNLAVLVPDVTQDPSWLPNPLLPETKAEIAVPIATGDRVLGVLDIQHNVTGGLKPDEVELIQSIANQVAIALQNTRSYMQAQRQAEREALINAIGQRIQSAATVESALQVTVRELGRALGAPRAVVRLKTEAKGNGSSVKK